jgi:hypothetical protein
MGSMIGGGNTKIILDSKSSKLPRNILSSAFQESEDSNNQHNFHYGSSNA